MRSEQNLQQEYSLLCAKLGELEYKLNIIKGDLSKGNDEKNSIIQKLQNLNKEFHNIKASQQNEDVKEAKETQDVAQSPS